MLTTRRLRNRIRATNPYFVDASIAVALTVISLLLGQESHSAGWRDFDAIGVVLTCLANLPIVLRRRAPMAVLLCCVVVWTVFIAAGYWPLVNSNAALLALYTVASRCRPSTTLLAALATAGVWVYGHFATQRGSLVSVIVQGVVFSGVVWKLGDSERKLVALNTDLRRQQTERAQRAIAAERLRIAREIHDVVAHHMSVISIQAGLARFVLRADPSTTHTALNTIADTSSEALTELRRLLTLLRDPPSQDSPRAAEPTEPAPGIARLGELVDRVRAAGLRVETTINGDVRLLPPGLDLCVYRVVQESLTNVLKHAGQARVRIELIYRADQIVASVTDDGDGAERDRPPGSGHGLLGMRERVNLYAGTLAAGPRPQGGYQVTLTLPTSP